MDLPRSSSSTVLVLILMSGISSKPRNPPKVLMEVIPWGDLEVIAFTRNKHNICHMSRDTRDITWITQDLSRKEIKVPET